MEKRDIVVVGTSTGGFEPLRLLVRSLPADFNGIVFIAMHVGAISLLPEILSREAKVPVISPENGTEYKPGHIYVAPPNRHLLIENGHIKLSAGARENRHRPSVDALFRSAARQHRSRVVGVVLSGALDDGVAGLLSIKARHGVAIVQDPEEAIAAEMPYNAAKHVPIDYALPAAEIAPLLMKLARGEAGEAWPIGGEETETELLAKETAGTPPPPEVAISCPDCSGALYEMQEGGLANFRCHVGHRFSPASLSLAHNEALERALWVAIRTMNERIALYSRMRKRESESGEENVLLRLGESMETAEQDVQLLREIIERI